MDANLLEVSLRYCPHIYHDLAEPFPIRRIGCTRLDAPGDSKTFPDLHLDPAACGAAFLLEYAICYDYDIQHLYELEHIWVAVDKTGAVCDCWSSFHGMRLRPAGLKDLFRIEDGTHPVLYAEPGKHALMPDPSLFPLHPEYPACCNTLCGGGLLIAPMFRWELSTTVQADAAIKAYMRAHFSFVPTEKYAYSPLSDEIFTGADALLREIPELVKAQLAIIRREFPW